MPSPAPVGRQSRGPSARSLRVQDGIGRSSTPSAERVSDDLRLGGGHYLARRRRTAAFTLAGAGALGIVALYQFGLVKHLPDPPLRAFKSDRVDAAGEAYAILETPDAALGLVSYGITLALAGMGAAGRASEKPWLPLALAGKVAADAAYGAYLTLEQGSKHRRFCSYCLVAAVASFASLREVLPEARASFRELRRRLRRW